MPPSTRDPAPAVAGRVGRRLPGHPAAWVLVLGAAYVGVLYWIDQRTDTFAQLRQLAPLLAWLTLPVLATYAIRYWRWQWTLTGLGSPISWPGGFAAYLAGFMLTASPGKAGELLRIRYFGRFGVPVRRTIGVFMFERSLDLLVVLMLSLTAASVFPNLGIVIIVAIAGVAVLFVAASQPGLRAYLGQSMARWRPWLRRLASLALHATGELGACLTARRLIVGLLAGFAAWGLTSLTFLALCAGIGIALPAWVAVGVYPLAMLVGAMSFVPGGVGTTELAIVVML